MQLGYGRIRSALVGLLAAAALLVLVPGLTGTADANHTPCTRYGDTRPGNLTKKHARSAVICLINKARNSHGRGDLHRDDRLQEAARKHSGRMADRGCFSHQCRGERDLLGRLQSVNYIVGGLTRWAIGENVAWGKRKHGTPRKVVQGWMNSSPHRANILSGTFKDIGAGFARKGDRGYYTADFGLRRG
jgi:uncharacterized protein YkwD